MKQITFSFNPFVISCDERKYKNISDSSKDRLDKTLANFCKSGQLEMAIYTDFTGQQTLVFERIKK